MNNETSITALMSAFGRAYHVEHAAEPVFADTKARDLMTDEEYSMIAAYILGGMDFIKDNLRAKLLEAGFSHEKKTFFSWLGVSMYLERSAIENMLRNISALAADGSGLVFDYADAGLFFSDVKRVQNMLAMAKAGGEEMKSSFDQISLELMLSECEFLVYEHLNCKEIQNRYFSKRSDWLSAFEHINYVHAVLKK